jgi:hypothetical protein
VSSTTPTTHDSNRRPLVSQAIDRCHIQVEASGDSATTTAWQQVLEGLEVVVDYDERIEKLEEQMGELWAYHTCENPGSRDIHD